MIRNLKHMESGAVKLKRIGAAASFGTFAASVLIQVCGVFQGIIVARLLGPVGRGEYETVILWPSLFAAIGILGTNIAISRVAAKAQDLAAVYRSAVLVSFFTSSLSMLACYLAIPQLIPSDQKHLVDLSQIFVIYIFANHVGLNLLAVDQGAGNFRSLNFTRAMLNPLFLFAILALFLWEHVNVFWIVMALLAANYSVVLVRAFLAFRRRDILGSLFSPKDIVKQSLHFGLAGIASPMYQHVDKTMLLWLLGVENLGVYVVALSVSGVAGSITGAAGILTLTQSAQAKLGEGFDWVVMVFRLSLLLWFFSGAALAFVIPWVLPLVYGADFAGAIVPAQLLVVGSAFAGLTNQLEQAMRGQGRAFVGLEGRLAGLFVLGVLGILLSKLYGLEGMCVAFVFSQLTCLLVVIYRVNWHYVKSSSMMAYFPTVADGRRILFLLGFLIRYLRPWQRT